MNFEPFMPFERADSLAPPVKVVSDPSKLSYFDRAGLVWILACVLFATTAGRLLPKLAEPNGLRTALTALGGAPGHQAETAGIAKAPPYTTVVSLPTQGTNRPQPTRTPQAKQEDRPQAAVVLRRF